MFVLILWDAVLTGSYLMSVLVCPIWFLVALVLAIVRRPGWRVAAARICVPPITLLLVIANSSVQGRIARANSARLIEACERYHAENGAYPQQLDELVPRNLSFVPRAKYCCSQGEFMYWNFEGSGAFFWWVEIPPYGRRTYRFDTGEWGYID